MNITHIVIVSVLTLCGLAGFAPAASADESPCPSHLKYFLSVYINNGFGESSYQESFENSELMLSEGSGTAAECYYVGAQWEAHPYAELRDPNHQWHASYSAIAAQL